MEGGIHLGILEKGHAFQTARVAVDYRGIGDCLIHGQHISLSVLLSQEAWA
jgi:hypothetical protein